METLIFLLQVCKLHFRELWNVLEHSGGGSSDNLQCTLTVKNPDTINFNELSVSQSLPHSISTLSILNTYKNLSKIFSILKQRIVLSPGCRQNKPEMILNFKSKKLQLSHFNTYLQAPHGISLCRKYFFNFLQNISQIHLLSCV